MDGWTNGSSLLSPIAQSVTSVANLRTGGRWFHPIPRIDVSHCDRIYSSLTTVRCFDNDSVGKQAVAWKEYCAEYWLNGLQKSMDRCTGSCNVNCNTVENGVTHHSINQPTPSFNWLYDRTEWSDVMFGNMHSK